MPTTNTKESKKRSREVQSKASVSDSSKRRRDVRPSDSGPKVKARPSPQSDRSLRKLVPPSRPANWPKDVEYLPEACKPSPSLPSHLITAFCSPFPYPMPIPSHHLSIRPITPSTPFRPHPLLQNTTHPAIGQNGLFAEVPLPPRTLICPYLGTVHGEAETDERSEYDAKVWAREGEVDGLEVGEGDVGLGIDATYAGNVARFVNDFRGIAQRANVTFEDWPSSSSSSSDNDNDNDDKGTRPRPQQQARGLALYTGPAGVPAGAELCVSYGKAFWEARGVLPATSRPP